MQKISRKTLEHPFRINAANGEPMAAMAAMVATVLAVLMVLMAPMGQQCQ